MSKDKKEMTPEEREDLLRRAKAAGIGTAGVSAIAGGLGVLAGQDKKVFGPNGYNPLPKKTTRGLKAAGVIGVPAGVALAAYAHHKLKKEKK